MLHNANEPQPNRKKLIRRTSPKPPSVTEQNLFFYRLFYRPQSFPSNQTAERADEQPVKTKSPPACLIQTENPGLGKKSRVSLGLRGERKIPHGFREIRRRKILKTGRIQTLNASRCRPKFSNQTQRDFLLRRFTEQDKAAFQQPAKGQTKPRASFVSRRKQRRQPAPEKKPANQPRAAQIQIADGGINLRRRGVNINLMPFGDIISLEEIIDEHDSSNQEFSFASNLIGAAGKHLERLITHRLKNPTDIYKKPVGFLRTQSSICGYGKTFSVCEKFSISKFQRRVAAALFNHLRNRCRHFQRAAAIFARHRRRRAGANRVDEALQFHF